ncbi:hypothetical protein SELMODRAFT_80581 [Selaginella moellendorffii]|uniref:uridine nucleosidase n=1 Tax=Selaginella moellendorffii TaxID=88036 RepID=D8QYE8_SELML|nr:probable uridine nucleosidase 2 [Selaginella moellendorffii]EFJ35597.1 hypothetical protein SELMODRAFT_80581 [Selaginella moellendorffii]|eukprot:XP_002963726.1 probable uridine nucleosidase 2 [Selaginella moellendorffii]
MAPASAHAFQKKVIIDTDPGIDDAMAILLAFQSPELDVIGLTTTFGNVSTSMATQNALHLCELAGREDIPVAQGLHKSLKGDTKEHAVDFIHGKDGLGNTNPPAPKGKPIDMTASEFFISKVKEFPGEVTIIALGPLTNLGKAVEMDPSFAKLVGEIVILGGAFAVNGNVNPAAEANVLGDPLAADIVLTCGANTKIIGINITHQVTMTGPQIEELRRSDSKYGRYLCDVIMCYLNYHRDYYNIDAIYLHDPATVIAAIDPSLFTYAEGVVRVQQEGICRGLTLFNNTRKKWAVPTAWCNKPPVKVAVTVDADKLVVLLKERLMAS